MSASRERARLLGLRVDGVEPFLLDQLRFSSAPHARTGVSLQQELSAGPTHRYRESALPSAYTFSYVPINALTTIVRGPAVSQALSLVHGINVDSGRLWISTA